LQSLNSDFIIGYMDDVTLGGSREVVANDVRTVTNKGEDVGLYLNTDKSELITKSSTPVNISPINQFISLSSDTASLLGAPLSSGIAMDNSLEKKLNDLRRASKRLQLISSHDALVLLRASCSAPKLMHVLRSAPCHDHASLNTIDNVLRTCLINITNVDITDGQWLQASLPVKTGGLGIRSVTAIAPSAFLFSVTSTLTLQTELLRNCHFDLQDNCYGHFLTVWRDRHPSFEPPTGATACKQRSWDKPYVNTTYSSLLSAQLDDVNRARLLAASAAHSGDWLHALPISSCGLRLDNEAVRIAVGLRLGANLCAQHVCPCGASVDCRGIHGLSCKQNGGKTARHAYINDLIHRGLVRAGVSSVKEPAGMLRSDGKRPDGLTLVPWQAGRNMVWDVTVIDTLAASYLPSTSTTAGSAAEIAASRKEVKYAELSATHIFVPIAFETLGPIGAKTLGFLRELGRRLTRVTNDPCEPAFLFQRLSVAIQRFNAVCVLGTCPLQQAVD